MRTSSFTILLATGSQIALGGMLHAQETPTVGDVFVAGVTPDARPVGAPVITQMPKDAAWYQQALTGVVPPYPASLRFLEDQGAWFNPFLHPGAPGPYDIRNWHVAD